MHIFSVTIFYYYAMLKNLCLRHRKIEHTFGSRSWTISKKDTKKEKYSSTAYSFIMKNYTLLECIGAPWRLECFPLPLFSINSYALLVLMSAWAHLQGLKAIRLNPLSLRSVPLHPLSLLKHISTHWRSKWFSFILLQ